MKISNLYGVYTAMRSFRIDRYRFEFRKGRAVFDVIFFIDSSPYVLLFGAKGTALSFEFEVERGFIVRAPKLDPAIYARLCQVLGLKYDPNNPFSPSALLSDFNTAIATHVVANRRAKPHEIATWRRDVEESDKIFFCGWLDNTAQGNRVTQSNLRKTLRLLGRSAYARCLQKNISSRWSDDKKRAVEFSLP